MPQVKLYRVKVPFITNAFVSYSKEQYITETVFNSLTANEKTFCEFAGEDKNSIQENTEVENTESIVKVENFEELLEKRSNKKSK